MKREYISDTIENSSTRPIRKKRNFFKRPFGKIIAAVLALCLIMGGIGIGIFFSFPNMVVTAYAHGTDEEITATGAVIHTGTISNTGEMTGHPLMFYLSGKNIDTVRFSCKNQQINFIDWTEKREEYGNAQNFTVTYGEDASEYYYLTIEWIPDSIIRELTDNHESTIAALPDTFREDMIVMELTFANGKTATKAITVLLLDDGTFFAKFDDYKVKETDRFVKRMDSIAIPREILYSEDVALSSDSNTTEDPITTVDLHDSIADSAPSEAADAVKRYYSDTVFEVVSMKRKSQTENEITFSVCVSKDGIVQEPERTIWLQLNNGKWEVTNEGY